MVDLVEGARAEWARQGWADAADGMAAVLELVRVQRLLTGHIEQTLKPFDLTFARYEALMLLSFAQGGGLSIGTLGQRLQVHSTSATNAVDRLEVGGLAERRRSRTDRRVVLVHITPSGRRVATSATEALNEQVFTELGITSMQGTRLWTLLRSFRAGAGDFDVVADRARRTG